MTGHIDSGYARDSTQRWRFSLLDLGGVNPDLAYVIAV